MRLSKSRYLAGLQCTKQLWCLVHDPARVPPPAPMTERIFAQGHRICEMAKKRYPNGYEIPFGALTRTISHTKDVLSGRIPLFEASFARGDAYCRVDILVPTKDAWDLIEVKSGTRVKDVNLEDVAFQRWVASRTIRIERCFVMHVDRAYVRAGAVDPERLFALEDVTEEVAAIVPLVEERVAHMIAVIDGPEPDVPIGVHCTSPYACPLIERCWDDGRDKSVLEAYHMDKERAFTHYHEGTRLTDLDPALLSEQQRIQAQAIRTGTPHIDRARINHWLEALEEPLIFLDFETASFAIPMIEGTRPYDQIPFQYSAHIRTEGTEHREHLAESPDPRREIAQSLLTLPYGTIIAYNASFEKRIISALADLFEDLRDELLSMNDRIVDLMTPFRSFWYYHPAQRGSASMKAILPALGIADYSTLGIGSGDQASIAWEQLVFGGLEAHDRERIRRELLEYCRLDTYGMIGILDELRSCR